MNKENNRENYMQSTHKFLINGGRWWNVARFAISQSNRPVLWIYCKVNCNISLLTSLERPLLPRKGECLLSLTIQKRTKRNHLN